MKLVFTLKDLVKYIIFIGVVYTILKLIPSQKLYQKDLFLIVIVIIGVFLLVEYFYKKETFENTNNKSNIVRVKLDPSDVNEDDDNAYSYDENIDYNYKETVDDRLDSDQMYDDEVDSISDVEVDDFIKLKASKKEETSETPKQKPKSTSDSEPQATDKPKKKTSRKPTGAGGNNERPLTTILMEGANITGSDSGSASAIAAEAAADAAKAAAEALAMLNKKSQEAKEEEEDKKEKEEQIQKIIVEKETLDEKLNSLLPSNIVNKGEMTCDIEIDKLKKTVEDTINQLENKVLELEKRSSSDNSEKYMDLLISDLLDAKILNEDDVINIRSKIDAKIATVEQIIKHLEKLKLNGKRRPKGSLDGRITQTDDFPYNELPPDFYKPLGSKELSLWDNQYTILNTDKWKVPMPKPPVCVNNSPCNVCPTDEPQGYAGYPLNLKEWDSARKFTNTPLDKFWAKTEIKDKGTDIYKHKIKNITFQESARNEVRHESVKNETRHKNFKNEMKSESVKNETKQESVKNETKENNKKIVNSEEEQEQEEQEEEQEEENVLINDEDVTENFLNLFNNQ